MVWDAQLAERQENVGAGERREGQVGDPQGWRDDRVLHPERESEDLLASHHEEPRRRKVVRPAHPMLKNFTSANETEAAKIGA